jgi:hypothetical protein
VACKDGSGPDVAVLPDLDMFINDGVGTDTGSGSNNGGGMDQGTGMDESGHG